MRHKRDAVRRQRGFPCSRSRGVNRACTAHCCAMVVRTWEEIPSNLRLESGPCLSPRKVHLPATGCDDAACGIFPKRLSSGAQEIDPRRLPGASDRLASLQQFISNPGSGTQEPVPRLRERMQEPCAAGQARKCLPLCISCARCMIVVKIKRKNWAIGRLQICSIPGVEHALRRA
jgi:hypothetical protein